MQREIDVRFVPQIECPERPAIPCGHGFQELLVAPRVRAALHAHLSNRMP